MKLLMHICCSNCSLYPLENFLMKGIDIRGLWFNPNIHPFTEYMSRLDSVKRLGKLWNLDIEYIEDYYLDFFLKQVAGQEERCSVCYTIRLGKTAELAKKMDMDGFSTSLLASPYQKFDKILEIGRDMGKRFDIVFYSEDVRQGWHISRGLSKELGLYRQKYCGCIYSEMERYQARAGKSRRFNV